MGHELKEPDSVERTGGSNQTLFMLEAQMQTYARFWADKSGSAAVEFGFIAMGVAAIVMMFVLNIAYRS